MSGLPGWSTTEIRTWAVHEFWNRFGPYGTASMQMVKEYPVSGIGIGNFNHISTDYAFMLRQDRAHMDNAQSWYRHQLAELGLVGSLGWLIWVPTFAWYLIRSRGDGETQSSAWMIKGTLVAIAVVSLVSMPTQSVPVGLSVGVFVFWYVLLSSAQQLHQPWPGLSNATQAAIAWGLAVTLLGGTLLVGWRSLRPPYRALRADWTYQVGFFDIETPASGPAFRWTDRYGIYTAPVQGPWLRLTIRGGPPDIAEKPVSLEVRRAGETIVSVMRASAEPLTWYVKTPEGQARMLLELEVGRTFRPADSGSPDPRVLGVAVEDWSFVTAPPAWATVIR